MNLNEKHTVKGHVAHTGNWVYYYIPNGEKVRRVSEKRAFALIEKLKLTGLVHAKEKLHYTNDFEQIALYHADKFWTAAKFAKSQRIQNQLDAKIDPYRYEIDVIDSMIGELHQIRRCFAHIRRDLGLYSLHPNNPKPLAEQVKQSAKRTVYRPARRRKKIANAALE